MFEFTEEYEPLLREVRKIWDGKGLVRISLSLQDS